MIRVIKDYSNPPKTLLNEDRKVTVRLAINSQDGNVYTNNDYSPAAAKRELEIIYKEKCAYCESKVKHCTYLEVEHYRPKAKVTEDATHKGYYWLGVEWSNLLLACPICNGQSAKGNKFPLKTSGRRVYHGTGLDSNGDWYRISCFPNELPLMGEAPLLLNPERDEPKLHLTFDAFGGLLGKTDEGIATIEICDLNRGALQKERENILNRFLYNIDIILPIHRLSQSLFNKQLRKIFESLESAQNSDQEYSLWGWFMYHNFEYCFLSKPEIPDNIRPIIKEAFNQFKKGLL